MERSSGTSNWVRVFLCGESTGLTKQQRGGRDTNQWAWPLAHWTEDSSLVGHQRAIWSTVRIHVCASKGLADRFARYRFRIINMSCALNYMFSIDGHLLQVIEADGVNHNPVVVDSLQIFAGQRYSVVVSHVGQLERRSRC